MMGRGLGLASVYQKEGDASFLGRWGGDRSIDALEISLGIVIQICLGELLE